jgi:hypothetical protein
MNSANAAATAAAAAYYSASAGAGGGDRKHGHHGLAFWPNEYKYPGDCGGAGFGAQSWCKFTNIEIFLKFYSNIVVEDV